VVACPVVQQVLDTKTKPPHTHEEMTLFPIRRHKLENYNPKNLNYQKKTEETDKRE
jgi:hypothetical protein